MTETSVKCSESAESRDLSHVPANFRPHLFKPGQSGNPAGKPKGVKNKLTETFIADLYESWQRRGCQALDDLATTKPGEYVRAVASIMPKDVMLTLDEQSASFVINAKPLSAAEWAEKHGVAGAKERS